MTPNYNCTQRGGKTLPTRDVLIHGAGIIGLSIALELERRGFRVLVNDRAHPLAAASAAAAGMLAVDDPHNPPAIHGLAQRSRALYPDWLRFLEDRGGIPTPFQTGRTWQYGADGSRLLLEENSLDPRMLAAALLAATKAHEHHIQITANAMLAPRAEIAIYASGAWQPASMPLRAGSAVPRKGQMLRVAIPRGLSLDEVHRSEQVYIVPRTTGPQAGSALIGATVEDAGFDQTVHLADLEGLRQLGSRFVPELASPTEAPLVESWAGLRPATPDGLPIIGRLPAQGFPAGTQHLVATGHYRNGILLAPATAEAIANLVEGKPPVTPLDAFSPARFL